MEPMDILKKPGIMSKLRNRRGFSLVEMAIVLVIIGVIIGAIIKGQDLITNSRAKQVTAAVSTWRTLALAYLDRNGRLPGDGNKDGVIGSPATPVDESAAAGSSIEEIKASMTNSPANPITVGSLSFYVYFGNVPGVTGTRNVITLCNKNDCSTPFTADELEIIKAIDTAQDGSTDAGKGQFRGTTIVPTYATSVITTIPAFKNHSSSGNTSTAWSTSHVAAVWAFDRPF